jgi:O-antigen ligase
VYLIAIVALLVMVREVPQLEKLGRDRYAQTDLERIQTFQLRVSYWETARELFDAHPLLGVGGGNFVLENERLSGQARVTHNMYVQAGVELGVIGLALMISLIWIVLRASIRLGRRAPAAAGVLAPLVTWLIFGIASSAFTQKAPYLFVGILLGLMVTVQATEATSRQQPQGSALSSQVALA